MYSLYIGKGFFFGNTPRDSNPWDILYLRPIAWDVQGTCIMFGSEKNIMVFQISVVSAV